ncbi:anti-sigma F factor antagonist [Alkalicella caledoniensis]|uniref:Anti-sigma F factor antagonist n=1 Tax=Alkalicella caledoniensis TaxID=2731377 RepID=A0A7G9WBY9_ALKCA|nr:anti-sigma F factor antagonist [Alkalicella caledoniensis]QNO16201.1 anti-sigma F factor antagonist [Alkalicella caledoniensis]
MFVNLKYVDKFLIVQVKGELDHHTAEEIKNSVMKELEKEIAINLIIDFSGLKFMDSSGIGMILGRYKEVQKLGGKMAITGLNNTVEKIIKLSGIQKIIGVYKTAEEAIANLKEEK